jgi:iron complex outermembrane receptor protein
MIRNKFVYFTAFVLLEGVFSLKLQAVTDLERIVVTRYSDQASGHGVVSATLDQDDIQKIPAQTPEDLVTYLGGDVQSRGSYGVKSDISFNASTFQQVLILVNGMRVKDPQTAHHDLDLFFNMEDVERVEIIPAASSSIYGPDGSGGAINFILKKPKKKKNSITLSGGNDETFEEKLNLFYSLKELHNSLSASHASSNGYSYDTDYKTDTFFHSSAFEDDNADVYFDAGYNQKEFGAYDFYTPGSNLPSKEWTNTKFFNLRSNFRKEKFTFSPRFLFRKHHDKFILDITRPSYFLNHTDTQMNEEGGELKFTVFNIDAVLGADYGEESMVSDKMGKHFRSHWDIYLSPMFEINEKTTLKVTMRQDDYSSINGEWTGSASLKHILSESMDGFVSLGRTIRVPTFTELYYSDPTTAGDPDLKPEHAYHLEAGLNKKIKDNVDVSGSFFVRQEYDTIDFTKMTPLDAKFIARNISQATTHGLNLYGQWRMTEKTAFDARYLFANKRQKSDGLIYKYGINYLKHMVNIGYNQMLPFGSNRLDFIIKKKPGRKEWVLVNDRLTWKAQKNCEVFLEVYNLFNVSYEEIVGIPQAGRQVKVGTTFKW